MNTANNSTPGTVFVLTYYEDDGLCEPVCRSSFESAYEEMRRQYDAALTEYGSKVYNDDSTGIYSTFAEITTDDNYLRWEVWEIRVDAPNEEASQ